MEDLKIKRRMVVLLEESERRNTERLDKITKNIAAITDTIHEGFSLLRQLMSQQQPLAAPSQAAPSQASSSNGFAHMPSAPPRFTHASQLLSRAPGQLAGYRQHCRQGPVAANIRTRDFFAWTDDEVELLLKVTSEYKEAMAMQNIDWESLHTKYSDILERYKEQYPLSEEALATGKDFPHKKDEITRGEHICFVFSKTL